MSENQETIVRKAPDDIVRGFIGGSIRYRVPHTYEINGKSITVDFAFVVEEMGKKHGLSANAIEEIVRLYQTDEKLKEHIKNLPRVQRFE